MQSVQEKSLLSSKYRSTNHVASTSNIVERANSGAKLILTQQRKSMRPKTVNMIMLLKQNKSLWPDARSLQLVLDDMELESDGNIDADQDVDTDDEEEDEDD